MEKSKISFSERIHFIGIGGIGMSGLAEVMKDMGFNVQGSDIANNKNIERCRKNGIKIYYFCERDPELNKLYLRIHQIA